MNQTGSSVPVAPVTPARWNDLVALFERPQPRGGRVPLRVASKRTVVRYTPG
jgi:hypothetical protein